MKFYITAFGQLTDIIGSSVTMDNIADTDGLTEKLLADYPALAGIKYRIAINKKIISNNTLLNDKTEIALLPPFSGG